MLLAYIDESGINYKEENGLFVDGPYTIYTAVLIQENKYFLAERMISDLAKQFLGIEKGELHATNIWRDGQTGKRDLNAVKNYFEELTQLVSKLCLPVVCGIQQKCHANKTTDSQYAMSALLTGLESEVSRLNQTAILIADKSDKNDLELLVQDRVKWRYDPGLENNVNLSIKRIKPKFEFEYKSSSFLDQLHYTNSNKSLGSCLRFARM